MVVRMLENGEQQETISKLKQKPEGNKHSYFLRNNANRLITSYRAIEEDEGKYRSPPGSQKLRDYYYNQGTSSEEDEDLANCLIMLSNKSVVLSDEKEDRDKLIAKKPMFQCKHCKRVFNSHQALGGHRASHKKVKGCYAARFDTISNNDDNQEDEEDLEDHDNGYHISTMHGSPEASKNDQISRNKLKGTHECSVCHRVFASGQALGGHKRCHWLTQSLADNSFIPNLHDRDWKLVKKPMFTKPATFDLNIPPVFLTITSPETDQNVDNNRLTDDFVVDDDDTKLSLQLWSNRVVKDYVESNNNNKGMHSSLHGLNINADHEKNEMTVVKFNEIKEMNNLDGWLQMGIEETMR